MHAGDLAVLAVVDRFDTCSLMSHLVDVWFPTQVLFLQILHSHDVIRLFEPIHDVLLLVYTDL